MATTEERLQAIETVLNNLQTATNNLSNKAQLQALLNVRQSEILDLQERVTSLESQIKILQSS